MRPLAEAELPRLPCPRRARRRHAPRRASRRGRSSSTRSSRPPTATSASPIDIGTTTLQLLLLDLRSGVVLAEAAAYNPQIPRGADVISRIVAAEKGLLGELSASVRATIGTMIAEACARRVSRAAATAAARRPHPRLRGRREPHDDPPAAGRGPLGHPPRPVRSPRRSRSIRCAPRTSAGRAATALVHTIPAVGGWVGGDIVAGLVRAGFSRATDGLSLYVDLGTNGEVALGGSDFALACACSAGPAFEGGGIRCGMRADEGAIDGARVDVETGTLDLSTIGGVPARGVCGSGLIALADALWRAGWIDRTGRRQRSASRGAPGRGRLGPRRRPRRQTSRSGSATSRASSAPRARSSPGSARSTAASATARAPSSA